MRPVVLEKIEEARSGKDRIILLLNMFSDRFDFIHKLLATGLLPLIQFASVKGQRMVTKSS